MLRSANVQLLTFVMAGLCITLLLEIGLIKLGADSFDKQFWVISKVFLVRSVFLGVASVQMLRAIFTYRYVISEELPGFTHSDFAFHFFLVLTKKMVP